jgi:16S rRNA (cytosine1402-N4)-methyltransferase
MMDEVFAALPLSPGGCYIDGTLGLAGHALEAGRRIAPGGVIIAFDWDADLMKLARERLDALEGVSVRYIHANFHDMSDHVDQGAAQGILLDLGVNNVHLEQADRGFSLRQDGPLDMRMDRSQGETAASFLNRASVAELENVIFTLGDERWARKIAQVIVSHRPLKTTSDLVECVLAAIPAAKRDRHIHPATRTFMGVRIKVNHELERLESGLLEIADLLAPGGVLVVLSYHSGEDRAVKNAFRTLSSTPRFEELHRKPLTPSESETARNPKARSAKMRALTKAPLTHPLS